MIYSGPEDYGFTQFLNSEEVDEESSVLVEQLYRELKRIASGRLSGENRCLTLNTTALVHEAWMRLQKSAPQLWRDRKQFFAAASEAMRRILVERARRRLAAKRGGGEIPVSIDEVDVASEFSDQRLVDVHEVLNRLEREDEFKARIVKMRFFNGLDHHEIAALLEVNEKTVRRHWAAAKVWLYRALESREE